MDDIKEELENDKIETITMLEKSIVLTQENVVKVRESRSVEEYAGVIMMFEQKAGQLDE